MPSSTDLPDQQHTFPTVVRLEAGRTDEAVAVFGDAFSDDPWARHMFQGNERSFQREAGNLFRDLVVVRLAKREPVIGLQIGGRLLNEVHTIVESATHEDGIGLDTDTPHNVALYRHFDYQTTALVDAGGIAMTCMFRPNPKRPGQARRQASPRSRP